MVIEQRHQFPDHHARQSMVSLSRRKESPEGEPMKQRLIKGLRDVIAFQTVADGEHEEQMRGMFDYIAFRAQEAAIASGRNFVVQEWNNNGHLSMVVAPEDPMQTREETLLHPKIAMLIHADVVAAEDPEMFVMQQKGDELYGRGALDMKPALAIGLDMLPDMPPGAALMITSDEEVGGEQGAKFLAETIGVQPSFLIILDGQKPEHVSWGAKGAWHARIDWWSLLNVGGHGSRYEDYPSNELAMDFRERLREHYPWRYSNTPAGTTFNIGVMDGGVATNKLSAKSHLKIDMRFPSEEHKAQGKEHVRQAMRDIVTDRLSDIYGQDVPYDVDLLTKITGDGEVHELSLTHRETGLRHVVGRAKTIVEFTTYDIDQANEKIQRFLQILRSVTGEDVKTNSKDTGFHDGRFWPEVPAIIYLPKGGGAHTTKEWVSAESMVHTRDAILQFMLEELQAA